MNEDVRKLNDVLGSIINASPWWTTRGSVWLAEELARRDVRVNRCICGLSLSAGKCGDCDNDE